MAEIVPFRIQVDQAALDDLKRRLQNTRFPEAETPDDWSQGVPLAYAQEITEYWLNEYNWRAREEYFNRHDQFKTNIDGLDIHFTHVRSAHPEAKPVVITHGWPGSVVEFHKVIDPLVDPVAFGGSAADAFHVICPSLPGFGFSGKPSTPGWGVAKIATAWDELMRRLGYETYFAQGGDAGSAVATEIGVQNRGACTGIHVNMPIVKATRKALSDPDEADKRALAGAKRYQEWGSGYSKQQSTRPQTIGYGLVDSPVGQAMWIIEKFYEWSDCSGHPENVLTKDELLDNVMYYWLEGNAASSARFYWESYMRPAGANKDNKIRIPSGCSIFPKEVIAPPRAWAEKRYKNLIYWNELDKGGHFAAFEQPELFVKELRDCFRLMP